MRAKPKRRRVRWILLALIALSGLFALTKLEGWVHRALERKLGAALGGTVSIESFELSYLPLEARFRGLRVRSPAVGEPLLEASVDEGSVRVPWSALPGFPAGRLRFAQSVFHRPILTVDSRFPEYWQRLREGPRRAIEWRVDRLRVTDGRFAYDDAEIPLELEANDVDAHATWGALRRALIGEIGMELLLKQPPFARPFPARLQSRFRLRGNRLELSKLRAEGPGLATEMEVLVALESGVPLTGRGELRADLTPLSDWLDPDFPPVMGRIEGELLLDRGPGPIHVGGTLRSGVTRFGPLDASEVTSRFDYRPGSLELTDLEAAAYGGRIVGDVGVTLGEKQRFRTRIEGRNLDVGSLLELVRTPLPFASRGTLELEVEGEPGDVNTWSAKGHLDSRPVGKAGGRLPARFSGPFSLDRGRVTVPGAKVRTEAAVVDLRLDLDLSGTPSTGDIVLDGVTTDADRTRRGVVRLLSALEVEPPAMLMHTLTGQGPIRTRIHIGDPVAVGVHLSLADGSWAAQRFREGALDLEIRGDRLDLRRVEMKGEDWSAAGSGVLGLDPVSVEAAEAEATGLPLDILGPLLGEAGTLSGRLSGRVHAHRGPAGLRGAGQLEVVDADLLGERITRIVATVDAVEDVLYLGEVAIHGTGLRAVGSAKVDLRTMRVEGTLEEGEIRLGELAILRSSGLDPIGSVVLAGPFAVGEEHVSGELVVRGRDCRVSGFELGEVLGELRLGSDGLQIDLTTGRERGLHVDGRVGWSSDIPLALDLSMDRAPVEITKGTRGAIWTRLTGRLRLEGAASRPETLTLRGAVESGELHLGLRTLRTRDPVPVSLESGRLSVGPLWLAGQTSDIETNLLLDLRSGEIRATSKGTLSLGILEALWPEARASGDVRLDVTVGGTADLPDIRGTAQVENGRLRVPVLPQGLDGIRATLRFSGDEARLDRLRALFGGGEVTGDGALRFAGGRVESYSLDLRAANVRMTYPEGFRGAYAGTLTLRGDAEAAELGGDLTLLRGIYTTDFDLAALLGYGVREYATTDDSGLPVRVYLNVGLKADRNVWLRNNLAELESRLDLHFGGELERPEVTGRIWIEEGGKVRFRRVDYRVRSGSLDFVDIGRINPRIELEAETTVKEYEIVLRVEGTLDHLDYQLTSDPALSPQDIIALLTTGRTLEDVVASGEGSRAFTGDVVGNYFANALTDPFERQIKKLLGLERVYIDPLLVGGEADPTARITLGKEVADDLFLVYSADLGSATERRLYQVEWQASRNLRLVAERDTLGGVGGDLRYSDRFWIPPRRKKPLPARREKASPSEAPAETLEGRRVVDVAIEGEGSDSMEEAVRRVAIGPGTRLDSATLFESVQAIRRHLVRAGRIEARVDAEAQPEGDDGVRLVYTIEPGPQVTVRLEGVGKKDRRRLRGRLETLWLETVFQEDLYEDAAESIREYFHEAGHFTADVVHRTGGDGKSRTVTFEVTPGPAVRVEEVRLEGVEGVAEQEVRKQMFTRPSGLFSRTLLTPQVLDADLAAVRNLYRDHGYLAVAIDRPRVRLAPTGDSAEVTVTIHEGPRFRVAAVDAPDDLAIPAERIAAWSGLKPGDVFAPKKLLEGESAVRSQLDRSGYPDARVRSALEIRENLVTVRLDVSTGSLQKVGAVVIRSDGVTREAVIRREVLLKPGDLVSRDGLLQSQHQLYKLGIFRDVRLLVEPMEAADPTLRRIVVQLDEAPPVGVVLGVGYDTEGGPRGSFSLSHANPGGRNRKIAFQGKASRIEQRLQWIARDPTLFGKPLTGILNTFWESREEVAFTADRRAVAFRIEKRYPKRWRQYLRYNFQKVDLTDVVDALKVREEKLENLKLGDVAYALVRDTRDDPFTPTRGGFAIAELRLFAPPLLSDSSFAKLSLQGSTVHTFRNGTSFASALRVGAAHSFGGTERVPLSERFFAGGDSTLRGFDRDSVGPKQDGLPEGGEALLLLNEEFHFPLWGPLRGTLFYDTGNVYSTVNDFDPGDLRHVLGVGLRLETPIGPLRFEYGRKLDREPDESSGEFFVAIGSAF